jgi:hypothetical protein
MDVTFWVTNICTEHSVQGLPWSRGYHTTVWAANVTLWVMGFILWAKDVILWITEVVLLATALQTSLSRLQPSPLSYEHRLLSYRHYIPSNSHHLWATDINLSAIVVLQWRLPSDELHKWSKLITSFSLKIFTSVNFESGDNLNILTHNYLKH